MSTGAFSRTRADYGDRFDDHVLEQYKMFVETEERLVSRRQEENRFFLSINSLLLAVLGFLFRGGLDRGESAAAVVIIGAAGLTLCGSWFFIIGSYRTLNTAKFKIIDDFERQLPARMFGAEWNAAEQAKYLPFTSIQRVVPFVLGALHMGAAVIGLAVVL